MRRCGFSRCRQVGVPPAAPFRPRVVRGLAVVCLAAASCGCTSPSDAPAPPTETSDTTSTSAQVGEALPEVLSPNWTRTAELVAPSVVAISVSSSRGSSAGSGVILDEQGHIVTNHHVVAGAGDRGRLRVTLWNEFVFGAVIVGSDPASDLAVLQIEGPAKDLTPIEVGDSDALAVGEPVMALGNPLGLAGTVTTGIVSALNRPVTTGGNLPQSPNDEPVVTNAIQTSAAINPGNSGGALVDAQGRLVGINSSIASLGETPGNIGIGFAITARQMSSVVDQILNSGQVRHPYLGVGVQDSVVEVNGMPRWAAGILRVESGSPANEAGLLVQDAIISIDGEPIDSALSLIAQIRERPPGTAVDLTIARDGDERELTVDLEARPN